MSNSIFKQEEPRLLVTEETVLNIVEGAFELLAPKASSAARVYTKDRLTEIWKGFDDKKTKSC